MLLFPNRVDNVYTLVMSMAVVLVVPSLSGCMVAFPIPIGYHILSSLLKTEHQKEQQQYCLQHLSRLIIVLTGTTNIYYGYGRVCSSELTLPITVY